MGKRRLEVSRPGFGLLGEMSRLGKNKPFSVRSGVCPTLAFLLFYSKW